MTQARDESSVALDSCAMAIAAMVERLSPIATVPFPLEQCSQRVLAQPLVTDRPSPACDVSAMDGYAVRVADLTAVGLSPMTIPVAGEVSMGLAPPSLPDAAALRIFTGAPIPDGCDAVIPREQVEERPGAIHLAMGFDVRRNQHIRRMGENAPAGAVVVEAGRAITPPLAAALAAFGVSMPHVHLPIRVASIVTGNELQPIAAEISQWQIRNSNGPTLATMLGCLPWIDWLGWSHAADDLAQLHKRLGESLERCDIVLLSGGVSKGNYDHVPKVVAELGCEILFHGLPIRPGKPILGAIGPQGQAILALPGNPVSVMTTARRIAAPVLRHRAGFAVTEPLRPTVRLRNADERTLPLDWFRPVRMVAPGMAELVANQGSGDLVAVASADGFVEIPRGASGPGPWPLYHWSLES